MSQLAPAGGSISAAVDEGNALISRSNESQATINTLSGQVNEAANLLEGIKIYEDFFTTN